MTRRSVLVGIAGLASVVTLGCLHAPVLWSPDGRWLAYTMAVRLDTPSLKEGWLFEADRAVEHPLERAEAAPKPSDVAYRLWATRADTGVSVLLEESRGPLTSPCWSPEGQSIAFGRLVPEEAGRARFEIVVQEAPDRKRVLLTRPYRELGARAADLPALAPAWSPDGRYLAVPLFQQTLGLGLIRADNGRLLKVVEDAYLPSWSPDGTKLAFVRGSDAESIYLLDDNFGPPRHLADIGQTSQAPVWSRDSRSLAVVTRKLAPRDAVTQQSDLIRIPLDGGKVETTTLTAERGEREKAYNGASFSFDRDGEDLFFAVDIEGQPSLITWYHPRTQETVRPFNPFDYTIRVGALALAPAGRTLAFRVGSPGYFSPPALFDPAENRLPIPLVPDDSARVEWLSTLIDAARGILRSGLPVAVSDGWPTARPTLLPIPGEVPSHNDLGSRLRRLGRIGRPLCDRPADAPPASPALRAVLDEARLFFAYLREDYADALTALEAVEARASTPDQRLRLLSLRAQIYIGQGRTEPASQTIAFLRSLARGEPRRLEITPAGPSMTTETDPSQGWPNYLALRAQEYSKLKAAEAIGMEERLGNRNPDAPDFIPAAPNGMVVPFAPAFDRLAPEFRLPQLLREAEPVVEPPRFLRRPPQRMPRFPRPVPPIPR